MTIWPGHRRTRRRHPDLCPLVPRASRVKASTHRFRMSATTRVEITVEKPAPCLPTCILPPSQPQFPALIRLPDRRQLMVWRFPLGLPHHLPMEPGSSHTHIPNPVMVMGERGHIKNRGIQEINIRLSTPIMSDRTSESHYVVDRLWSMLSLLTSTNGCVKLGGRDLGLCVALFAISTVSRGAAPWFYRQSAIQLLAHLQHSSCRGFRVSRCDSWNFSNRLCAMQVLQSGSWV